MYKNNKSLISKNILSLVAPGVYKVMKCSLKLFHVNSLQDEYVSYVSVETQFLSILMSDSGVTY